jgi:hypothetical protein
MWRYLLFLMIYSPNQQDQSRENLAKMMKLIFEEKPKNTQLILGLVELGDYKFEGEIIELDEKHSVLKKSEYESLSKEVRNLLDICYTHKQPNKMNHTVGSFFLLSLCTYITCVLESAIPFCHSKKPFAMPLRLLRFFQIIMTPPDKNSGCSHLRTATNELYFPLTNLNAH